MTIREAADRRHTVVRHVRFGGPSRSVLLAGVSAMALVLAAGGRASGVELNGGLARASAPANVSAGSIAAAQQAAAAVQRGRESLLRATQALQSIQGLQAAAAAAARNSGSPVPNGLGQGGLKPVANPLLSAQDTTGLRTWDGALQPSQSVAADGRIDVNIRQTQSNAILSWDSFNVGRETRLTFDQQGNTNWVALNRVVGADVAPSRILGGIKSDGTVLVVNRNGIIFGGSSQINVGSLMASSLDVGPATVLSGGNLAASTIGQRNQMFLQYGLLGLAETLAQGRDATTFSALQGAVGQGAVTVQAGARIATSRDDGLLLFAAPQVVNSGYLSARKGQIALVSGTRVMLTRATGAADSANPNVRGFFFTSGLADTPGASLGYVWNTSEGLIEAAQGNITLSAVLNGVSVVGNNRTLLPGGAVINDGVLRSTTSVARNGSIVFDGGDIRLSSGGVMSIGADPSAETIPQEATALVNFKPSYIQVGSATSNVEMQSGALISAPGGNVTFGVSSGASVPGLNNAQTLATPTIFIDRGAIIDVAGLTDVLVPASRNQVVIAPVKGNELRDSPLYRAGFLSGATVYLDPRLSGVRADGVAWIGSPLIDAASYYALVGVGAAELMTRGGNVTFGATAYNGASAGTTTVPGSAAASVIVKPGAIINMAGGWVTYEAGNVRTTTLVSASGRLVSIGNADPNDTYVGIYKGFTVDHARWGVKEIYASGLRPDEHFESEYTEGRDAGSLTLKAAATAFDGTIYGDAFAGLRQRGAAKTGSGKSTVYGDKRAVQGAASELPAGGMLFVQTDSGGGDIRISRDPAPLPDSFGYGQRVVIAPDRSYVYAPRDPNSILPAERLNTATISSKTIADAGLSEVALYSGGSITVDADARVVLNPGGIFDVFAGRNIRIAGGISAPGGKVMLETYFGLGSIFAPTAPALGSFDIVVAGSISVAGRWVNDFNASPLDQLGGAWLNGGSISMYVASRNLQLNGSQAAYQQNYGLVDYNGSGTSLTPTDISGSILINPGAKLNLAGGGRVDRTGNLTTTARGGNLSLRSDTGYFQITTDPFYDYGRLRVATTSPTSAAPSIVNNPSQINTRIAFARDAIEAHGFGGGGTFTLVTPQIAFGEGTATTGTVLPLDFFSSAGFSTYNITSYKTDLSPSTFANGKGGTNAILATQTLTVGAGQTLLLAQSVLPNLLSVTQAETLRNLPTGADVLSVLSPIVPDNAWDSRAVNLNLGGLLELHVAQGGRVVGAAGSALTVPKLLNEGTIRLPGGAITQQLVLPSMYAGGFNGLPANDGAVHALSDIFSIRPDGSIDLNAPNAKGLKAPNGRVLTNGEVAGDERNNFKQAIYFLGLLEADQGVVLAPGSVTDLSGAVIVNPYALRTDRSALTTGRVVAGGTLASPAASQEGVTLFAAQQNSVFAAAKVVGWRLPEAIVAQPGAVLDLSGVSGAFDQLVVSDRLLARSTYVSMPVWSDAGVLMAANGATLSGATIRATGGAPQANGGTLVMLDPVLAQHDPALPTRNVVSADMVRDAGFDTLAAIGSVGSLGDATVKLGRGFFLQSRPYKGLIAVTGTTAADPLLPVVRSGGRLEIDAPYVGFLSSFDTITNPGIGTAGTGSVIFKADQIDISGAVIFDKSVASATLQSAGDIRLTGVQQWQRTYLPEFVPTEYTLTGAIAANGDVSLIAGQVYPTTGSTFTISTTAPNGTVAFGRSGSATPATPYSAGGNLNIYAANIRQGGVVRVPFGTLTLGSNTGYAKTASTITTTFAPPTQSVTLLDGSLTGVSANGLVIPYGITTDQKEWYFAPTSIETLNGPPVKVMQISGARVAFNAGATIDLTGGGDVYAYEFIPGTGGSRDVLDRFNRDQYSGNKGYQYADGRQVYAIVPGFSGAVALNDPIYSADYASLYSVPGAGRRVYLDAAPGLTAGWYTLLPAKYAMLPGGMRVVEQTAGGVLRGTGAQNRDGSLYVSGFYGDALAGTAQSDVKGFSVQSQAVILQNSRIALTSGDAMARKLAANSGKSAPRLGVDAARLVLNPVNALAIDATLSSAAAPGGRGSQVDIGGRSFDIVSRLADAPADGAIHVTADSLTRLNAGSLLIGGIRTDNADGTTSLNITAQGILVANDAAHPLSAAEIVLVVDDQIANPAASRITLADGAALIATGALADQRSGNYIIDGRVTTKTVNSSVYYTNPLVTAEGALFRVANGPERLVTRLKDAQAPARPSAALTVGNIVAMGSVIGLDTSGTIDVAGNAVLQAKSISLGAPKIAFTAGAAAAGTVVLTPELQRLLTQGDRLTLHAQSTIGFDNGAYRFASVNFDAQNLVALGGGNVAITADRLVLGNSGAAGTAAGGTGVLDLSANEIRFGSGVLATTGFGAGVRLTAATGMFSGGIGSVFDVGGANLTIATPYLGDRAATATGAEASSDLTFRSTGAVVVTNAGLAPFDASRVAGVPGSALSIEGNGITVSGTRLRATAGVLNLRSSAGITLSDAPVLEAPGYEKAFGDRADAVTRSSHGGALKLWAGGTAGINLGNATLSVGGGKGNGGQLSLSTPNGSVDLASAVLNGAGGAGQSGGSFALDTMSAIDLVALNNRVGALGFTGGFDLRTRTGDIVLADGQTLRSGAVNLTADGGFVVIGGRVDTSGVNGGNIGLYGTRGVTLLKTAMLDASASGYPADDTRQAKGGNVTLGTDFIPGTTVIQPDGSVVGASGALRVTSGATIDVSARRPGARLVPLLRNGVVYYQYVDGDQGGVVTLRAPVVDSSGGKTVNVKVDTAASVSGARAIDLEGFKRWDLATVAASGLYSGVTNSAGTIVLDVAAGLDKANSDGTLTTVAGLNFLGDYGAGTVVEFVRNFDVSSAYANLGGLASQSNFQARPGIDLTHTGNIDLNSNWNLGAGVVNVDAAKAAGQMAVDPNTGAYVVVGQEAALLANAMMIYRVGGRATGAAPIVSLRAGGDLHLKGSITDGFFQFRDQYDPTYLGKLAGGATSLLQLIGGDYSGYFVDWSTYTTSASPWSSYPSQFMDSFSQSGKGIDELPSAGGGGPITVPKIPFNPLGNSPAALGSGPDGLGDALASAVVFPTLAGGAVGSSGYRLVAGAAPGSVDPLRVAGSGLGTLIVDGAKPSTMIVGGGSLKIEIYSGYGELYDDSFRAGQPGFDAYLKNLFNPNGLTGLADDSAIVLPYRNNIPATLQAFIDRTLAADPNAQIKVWKSPDNAAELHEVALSLSLFSRFLAENPGGFSAGTAVPLMRQTMIRTGTGSIDMAAAGDVDLRGSAAPVYVNAAGAVVPAPPLSAEGTSFPSQQLGGAAIYTAGRLADLSSKVVFDPVSQAVITIPPPKVPSTSSIFNAPPAYDYGTGNPNEAQGRGVPGVVLADPVYLTGGGNVTVLAGRDVLGRRNMAFAATLRRYGGMSFIGTGDQPWRMGVIGPATNVAINPQLFNEGLGALGGGNIVISAGRDVSDISLVSNTSLLTSLPPSEPQPGKDLNTRALLTFGGGNVSVVAGRDVLGGRLDLSSGVAVISAGRNIADAESILVGTVSQTYFPPGADVGQSRFVPQMLANQLRIRVSDATADLSAGGAISLQGIGALGVAARSEAGTEINIPTAIDNMYGFYSAYSGLNLLANGRITVANDGDATRNGYYDLLAAPNYGTASDTAIYPASLTASSIAGDVSLLAGGTNVAKSILLVPSSHGQLRVLAGRDIAPTTIAMLDSDPGQLAGLFSTFRNDGAGTVAGGLRFDFPAVFSTSSNYQLAQQHNKVATHGDDRDPVYLYAGNDIGTAAQGLVISVPKQTRINAGNDIINMMFFGQNLADKDITRIVAGRDITATTKLVQPLVSYTYQYPTYFGTYGAALPALQGNAVILGGPGELFVEAGRTLGPFLNSSVSLEVIRGTNNDSATVTALLQTFGGGILSVGNQRNPYLPPKGASVSVLFGVGNGADYDGLREAYVAPGSAAYALGNYGVKLVDWMRNNASDELLARYHTTDVSADEAYAAFVALPELRQRSFLIRQVYFNELAATADPKSVSYHKYSRGYAAVNALFPSSLGYTSNKDGEVAQVSTGDLDLRLAAIETMYGGDVSILGPGGRVIAGSVVATSQQAERRTYDGARLFAGGQAYAAGLPTTSRSIPPGYEGVLTLRGGNVYTFTDGDFLLNQSRLFTQQGGDIKMWSSNGDLNAGQGPKTSVNFPPIVARSDQNAVVTVDVLGGVTGAGIAALKSTPDAPDADVYLIAPRGTVDLGDAGVRVSGNFSVAALVVVNADNVKVGGTTTGIPTVQAPNIGGLTEASATTANTQQAAVPPQAGQNDRPSIVLVEVLGFGGGSGQDEPAPETGDSQRNKRRSDNRTQDPHSRYQVVGVGELSEEEAMRLAGERQAQIGR